MRPARLALLLPLLVLLAVAPAPVLADHCGAGATITPRSGSPGTTFVFRTNLGAPTDLHLYLGGTLIRSVFIDDGDAVRYAIKTGPGDAGSWLVRAEVRGFPDCAADASFTVAGTPDTSTEPAPSPGARTWLLEAVAGGIAVLLALRRSVASRPS